MRARVKPELQLLATCAVGEWLGVAAGTTAGAAMKAADVSIAAMIRRPFWVNVTWMTRPASGLVGIHRVRTAAVR